MAAAQWAIHDDRGGRARRVREDPLAEYLKSLLPGFAVVNGDDWFEPLDGALEWGDFNEERFARDVLRPLARADATFTRQRYDFAQDGLLPAETVETIGGVLVERCFSLAMAVTWDLRIWVETPPEVCLARGLARDGMPADRVRRVWTEVWQPAEDAYIAEHQPLERADLVIDGTAPFGEQIG